MSADPKVLIQKRTGDWWSDDRRDWCAYCGVAITRDSKGPGRAATKDHVVPRAHKGRHVTIPACRECNQNKGSATLPDFMISKYFDRVRKRKRPNQWKLSDLWLVMALAAVEQARSVADPPPVD